MAKQIGCVRGVKTLILFIVVCLTNSVFAELLSGKDYYEIDTASKIRQSFDREQQHHLRIRRDAPPTDQKTQYENVRPSVSSPISESPGLSGAKDAVVVHAVVNATTKDGITPTSATLAGSSLPTGVSTKKAPVASTLAPLTIKEMSPLFDEDIDVDEGETVKEIKKQNLTRKEDHHTYYNSTIYENKQEADAIWNAIRNTPDNSMLSSAHRRAMTVDLGFQFPFYGHYISNVTIATGGFLYTGEYVHSWLAATQYIAPLMANFDTSKSKDSFVRYESNGTAFTVLWENVMLQDNDKSKFTFSATLHQNGDIVFVYFNMPTLINTIQDSLHPVKVGLSDAYIFDKTVFFSRRKTIYEYHRVSFENHEIVNSTIIYLKALPTCLAYTDCAACLNHETGFECVWCPQLNRCSSGTDRRKQEWNQKGCDHLQITEEIMCPPLGKKGNNANQTNASDYKKNGASATSSVPTPTNSDWTIIGSSTTSPKNAEFDEVHATQEPKNVGVAFGFFVPICLVCVISLWVLYAYRNPHTKSGQLLIQYRPSQWSWRRGEARYTAATIHM